MSDADNRQVIVRLELGDNGGLVEFSDIAELRKWIDREFDSWQWIQKSWRDEAGNRAFVQQCPTEIERAQKELKATNFNAVQQILQTAFRDRRTPCSQSKYGILIADAAKRDPAHAARLVRAYKGDGLKVDRQSFAAQLQIAALECGLPGNEAEKAALLAIANDSEKRLSSLHEAMLTKHNAAVDLLKDTEAQKSEQKSAHDTQMSDHEKRMRAIEQKFTDEMSVRVAVKYWADKANDHWMGSMIWGVASAAVFLVGIGILWNKIAVAEPPSVTVAGLVQSAAAAGTPLTPEMIDSAANRQWLSLITTKVLFLLLLVWPVRILVRNYLSHSHLRADAKERQLVIQTYLALLNDPDVQGDKELKGQILPKALENIFRHTQTGMVRDDALPQAGIFNLVPKG